MPAKFRARITWTAEEDIEEISTLIAQDSEEEADEFIHGLEEQIETPEQFPERCYLIPENEILAPAIATTFSETTAVYSASRERRLMC